MEPMRVEVVRAGPSPLLESYDATSLFEEAGVLLGARDFDGALALYDRLLTKFPDSRFASAALYNSGLAAEGKGDFVAAAERYKTLAERYPTTRDGRDGLFLLGSVYAELKQWQASAEVFERIVAARDLEFQDRIEALARKGLAHYEMGDLDRTERTMREAVAVYQRESQLERLDSGFFAGMAHHYVAVVSHARCQQVPVRLPQAQMAIDLNEKAGLLLQAQNEYIATIRIKDPHWATAAGYQIGALYTQFHDALLAAPIPPELNEEARQIYVEELGKTIRPLIEKAVGVFEKTVLMAERVGVRNDWVERTNGQLDVLRQLLSGEQDRGVPLPPSPAPDPKPGHEPPPAPPPVVL